MRVTVDPDTCTGCELCVETCPDLFEMSEDEGIAQVRVDKVREDAEDCARQAEEDCPVDAITVEE
jgi:ferredoxin